MTRDINDLIVRYIDAAPREATLRLAGSFFECVLILQVLMREWEVLFVKELHFFHTVTLV